MSTSDSSATVGTDTDITVVSTNVTIDTIGELVTQLQDAKAKLRYAQSTICQLELQNKELDSMLGKAYTLLLGQTSKARLNKSADRAQNTAPSISEVSLVPSNCQDLLIEPEYTSSCNANPVWINSTWLVLPQNKALLGPTEAAWHSSEKQKALCLVSMAMVAKNILPERRVDAHLLASEIVRSAADGVKQSLHFADLGLQFARENDLYDMIGKAQFYRGLCFLQMEMYADASWCFMLASHTDGFKDQVQCYRAVAEKSRLFLCSTDPRRTISPDFT